MKLLVLVLLALSFSGCITASRMNELSVGMTKDQVTKKLGAPNSTEFDGSDEILVYILKDSIGDMFPDRYFVNLRDGAVSLWGKVPRTQGAVMMPAPAFQPIQFQPVQYQPTQPRKSLNCTSNRVGDQTYTNCN